MSALEAHVREMDEREALQATSAGWMYGRRSCCAPPWCAVAPPSHAPKPSLDKPFAHTPLVLVTQDATELGQRIGRIVEHSEDRLAIVHGKTDNPLPSFECYYEPLRRFVEAGGVEQPSQLERIFVSHADSGDVHPGEASPPRRAPNARD